jgi:dienelactone hydrolase
MMSGLTTLLLSPARTEDVMIPAFFHHRARPLRIAALAGLPLVFALALGAREGPAYLRGAAFVVEASGMQGTARSVASWETLRVTEHDLTMPWRSGVLRGREYVPELERGRPVLLVPGVHAAGIDEPRLIGFARQIAAAGHRVYTAQLDDLAHYLITTRTTDMIEDAALFVSSAADRGAAGAVGMLGISFGGGLSIVAAGRPALRGRVAYVMAFGGHGDLPRTLKYLCTGIQADGALRPPHDYGLAIVLLGAADRVVPADEVMPLRDAIRSYLEASRLDMLDKPKAALEFAHARKLAETLGEPARTYMSYVNARDVARLGPVLLPHVADLGGDPRLSPSRSPFPRVPVYLLHGTDDNVVPAIESVLLARDLAARAVPVHLLLTPLITHAEVDRRSSMSAIWGLIHFWTKLLDE